MRTLIASLTLLSLTLAQKPPAPFSDPNYDADDPKNNLIYEATVKVPKDGKVVISFGPERFKQAPSCSFDGGTIPGERPTVTKTYASIKARRGAKLHYKCSGVRE